MWARGIQPRIEGARRTSQSVQRHGANRVGRMRQRFSFQQFQASNGQHGLRAVHQRNAFFRCQHDWLNRRAPQRVAARNPHSFELGLAFADQHQRDMRQRSKIAARPHAALRWNHRRDAAIQQVAQSLGYQRPNPGKTFGQHIGANQHHGANFRGRQRIAHPAGVRADNIALQLLQLIGGHANIGQQSHASIYRINRRIPGREPFHHGPRPFHSRNRWGSDLDGFIAGRHLVNFGERQTRAVEGDHLYILGRE